RPGELCLPVQPRGQRGRGTAPGGRMEVVGPRHDLDPRRGRIAAVRHQLQPVDRKSTRLNSSHRTISYAVFCLKKKKKKKKQYRTTKKKNKNNKKRERGIKSTTNKSQKNNKKIILINISIITN